MKLFKKIYWLCGLMLMIHVKFTLEFVENTKTEVKVGKKN